MIKLVALDLDGTIVNEKLEISDRTLKTLQRLIRETEVKVVIATGRMFPSTLPFSRQIGITTPLITYQGAMIRADLRADHTNRQEPEAVPPQFLPPLAHTPIPMVTAKAVLDTLKHLGYRSNLYVDDVLFTDHEDEYANLYAKVSGVTPIQTDSLHTYLTAPPTKIMAIDDHRIDALLPELESQFGKKLNICKSRYNFCEIIDTQASKWNAIKTLAVQWRIAPAEVMAIGDHGNDYSMISQAGMGVAMGNATPEIKAVAKYVTDSIADDGAAKAIEKFILN